MFLVLVLLPVCRAAESDAASHQRCSVGDGLAVWNSKQCLLEQNFFPGEDGKDTYETRVYFEGRVIGLDEEHETISIREGNKLVKRPGTKPKWAIASGARTFSRNGIHVTLRQRKMGKCDYNKTQCTAVNFRASLELKIPGRSIIKFSGVGFEGS